MKSFSIIAIVALVIAAAGICYDYSPHVPASWISYVSCLPLLGWVVLLLVKGAQGSK
jgi:hypothetical protein